MEVKHLLVFIASVSETRRDVIIINLKDLTFSSNNTAGNFDPDNPYGGAVNATWWNTGDKYYENVQGIENFTPDQLFEAVKDSCSCACQFYPPE